MRTRSRHSATPSVSYIEPGEETGRKYREAQAFIVKQRTCIDYLTQNSKELQGQYTQTSHELVDVKRRLQEVSGSKILEMKGEIEKLRQVLREKGRVQIDTGMLDLEKELREFKSLVGAKDRQIGRLETELKQTRSSLEEKITQLQTKELKLKQDLETQQTHLCAKHQKLEEVQLQLNSATTTIELLQSAVIEKENEVNAVKA